ncbi:6905_t:CDS:2, partial [Entrophospora sp. SA101]
APVQVFNITDIIDIKHEKKHIIIQFGGAKTTTFDFQSNKHSEIFQKIKDCRTSLEIPTVKPPITIRVALYDFKAQGDDEISIREGDKLWIIGCFIKFISFKLMYCSRALTTTSETIMAIPKSS